VAGCWWRAHVAGEIALVLLSALPQPAQGSPPVRRRRPHQRHRDQRQPSVYPSRPSSIEAAHHERADGSVRGEYRLEPLEVGTPIVGEPPHGDEITDDPDLLATARFFEIWGFKDPASRFR
jgi:hypothetical protein